MSEIRIRLGQDWDLPVELIRVPTGQSLESLRFRCSVDTINGTTVIEKTITSVVTPGQGRITKDGSDGKAAEALFEGPSSETATLIPGKAYYWDVWATSSAGKTFPVRSGTLVALEDVS